MKLKKYGKGGKYAMYQNGGPVKAKKMSKEEREKELTKMSGVAKERLEELAGEKAYLAKRKEADQAYKSALKDGATEEQAAKLAEKVLSNFKHGGKMYLKGGQVKLDKDKDGKITGKDFKMMKAKKKKYADGGKVSPKEVLDTMTKNRLMQALKDAGVGVPTGSGVQGGRKETAADAKIGGGALFGDMSLEQLTSYAKKKGVYQDARQLAVADWRKKFGQGVQ